MSESTLAYIALGSNLQNPLEQVKRAISSLAALPNTQLIAQSKLYRTKPVGKLDQPDFINAVVALQVKCSAQELLRHCQAIEKDQGRVRPERWGPRTLDVDILLFGDEMINGADLMVPHPRMRERAFVLVPLADIAPNLVLPDGTLLQNLLPSADNNLLRLE